ncbi:MAG: hypothetical protein QOD07_2293, partial [Frankiaceae bacterium]|nr:hypothetical protein [Frankiaceae bacterium]
MKVLRRGMAVPLLLTGSLAAAVLPALPASASVVVYTYRTPLQTTLNSGFIDLPGATRDVTLLPTQSAVVWTGMTLDAPQLTSASQGAMGATQALVCLKSTGGTDGGSEAGTYSTPGNLSSINHNSAVNPQWVVTNGTTGPITYTCKVTIRFYSLTGAAMPGIDVTVATSDGSPVTVNINSTSYQNDARWTLPSSTPNPPRQIAPGTTGVTLGYGYQLVPGAANVAFREFANLTQCQAGADGCTSSTSVGSATVTPVLVVQPENPVTGATCAPAVT